MSPRGRRRAPVKRDPNQAAPDDRIWGRNYRGPAPWVLGLIVAIIIVILAYLAFVKEIPLRARATR